MAAAAGPGCALMNAPLRLVFLGSDPIALPVLDWLAGEGRAHAAIVAVYTQPDRAVGRGQKVQANAIKNWACVRGVPLRQPERLAAPERDELAGFVADVALVMAYGHILRDDFIATPRLGTLNLHTSLLPQYRGAAPIQTAVACGERETGVTLMRIVRRLDAGPVADRERVAIGALDTAADVTSKLAAAGVPLVARALPRLARGELLFAPQDESVASFCRKLVKADGVLDFSAFAAVLAARINGLFPWPACGVTLAGEPIKLGLADAPAFPEGASPAAAALGEVLGADAEGLLIAAGGGSVLRLRRLQRPGGRMLEAAEFLRGFPVPPGTRLASQPMPPLLRAAIPD